MAVLQRVRILPNERFDRPDFNKISEFLCADLQALQKFQWTDENFVVSGFESLGTGTTTLSVQLANSAAIIGANSGQYYIGAPSLGNLETSTLTPNTTNFVELFIDTDTGGADSRAFWDQTANGGDGAEFSQIIDTFIFLKANFAINTSSFTGASDKVKICEVDVDASGVITQIRDARDSFFRLGRASNNDFNFLWTSRTEPLDTDFGGADKDIKNLKQMLDALMSGQKEIKGTDRWFEEPTASLNGLMQNLGLSILTGFSTSARFGWDGNSLTITDDNVAPTDSDILAKIRLGNLTSELSLTRQDGANSIDLLDGEMLWVQIPESGDVSYDGEGFTSTNYRINSRGSVPLDDSVYYLAYREGSRVYLRGLGELEAGEERQVNDETSEALSTFLGFNPETATSVPYATLPNGLLSGTFTTSDSLVTAISVNTENINQLSVFINSNVYEESLTVVDAAPGAGEIQTIAVDPVTGRNIIPAGTIISLPPDSRDGNSTELYTVGNATLKLYTNGKFLIEGVQWQAVGLAGSVSSDIELLEQIETDDILTFRQDSLGGITNTAGGTSSLQDAYNVGRTIVATTGQPFEVTGPVGEKIARFLGDIEVTGVVDPTGIEFIGSASNPLAKEGLWLNNSGEIILEDVNGATNLSQIATGNSTSLNNQGEHDNNTGSTLPQFSIVREDNTGSLNTIDVSVDTEAESVIGITSEEILDGETGKTVYCGRLQDIGDSFTIGDTLFVDKAGLLSNVKPDIGVGGFIAGDFVIKVGHVVKNRTVGTKRDLIVRIVNRGAL